PFADFAGRFFTPWAPPQPFEMHVTPGSAAAGKGRPLTLTVQLVPNRHTRSLPDQCVLLYREGDNPEKRLPLTQIDARTFSFTVSQVQGDFAYQIEAGPVVSEVFDIQVIEPVELAAQSPRITVMPPAYANPKVHPAKTPATLADAAVLEFGGVRLDFRFTRPAVSGVVHLQAKGTGKSWDVPLSWPTDRQS